MDLNIIEEVINDNIRLREENKKLKEELEQSRIAVMLSQIQPHFLYNSLTSVMDLCDTNPKQAKAAVADFADYLRGNLASLKTENLIYFRTELEHIQKYLRLEKLRFRNELEIILAVMCYLCESGKCFAACEYSLRHTHDQYCRVRELLEFLRSDESL